MSEIKKNIETCRGEDVLAEVSAAPQDPHFGSLVNEALDPLKQQALHQAGYNGYSEVIEQHKPYTFVSAIIQMKSNLLLLLRALWQFPFGSASLRSLADMWQHYITRLQGNETYGIPSRLSNLTDLPSAPLLLADRKISGADVADGISLAHILFNNDIRNGVTELVDDNGDWNANHIGYSNYGNYLTEFFPNLKKIRLVVNEIHCIYLSTGSSVEEFELPNAEYISLGVSGVNGQHIISNAKVTELNFPSLTKFTGIYGSSWYWFANLPNCKKVSFPVLNNITYDGNRAGYSIHYFGNCPELEEVHFNVLTNRLQSSNMTGSGSSTDQNMAAGCPKLRLFEIGQGYSQNLYLAGWNPDSETLAHQDFLPNFRNYIALRLADNGSGLTLTLSQAVFSSIWDANGNPQVLQDGLDQLRADIHNIVKTTKHWDVNKAN